MAACDFLLPGISWSARPRPTKQRSINLRDREDWQTVTTDGSALELTDDSAGAPQRFYRAMEDDVNQEP